MTDIARLGFSADTDALKKAKADLEALVPSANKAADAARKVGTATGAAAPNTTKLGAAASGTATTTTKLGAAASGAAANISKIPAAANGSASSLNRLGKAANDNINRLQSTPGNIAAQFQDIGVTAAAGMNPMLIALQQGTQLSSAMAGGFKNVIAGFTQLFSVTTVLTIGLVALVAAGLQMIDWISVAKSLLNGLADSMETVALAAAYLGVVLAVAFAPQIIVMIAKMTGIILGGLLSAIKAATVAMIGFAAANPFAFIVLAIGAVVAAMYLLNDTFGGVFTDALAWVRKAANFIIGALVGAFNSIKATWKMLPAAIGDYVIQAANAIIKTVEGMVNASINLINGLTGMLPFGLGDGLQMGNVSFGEIPNPLEGMADKTNSVISEEMGKAQGVDYVGGIIDGIKSGAAWAADKLRGIADGLGLGDKDKKKKSGMSDAEKAALAYLELVKATEARIKSLEVETAAIGMTAAAARRYRNEQDLIAQALAKNIPLTDQIRTQLSDLAQRLTDAEVAKEVATMTKAFEEQQRVLSDNAALIGLTGRDLDYVETYQNMLNDAIERGIPITAAYNRLLRERAGLIAGMMGDNREAKFMADVVKGHEETIYALQREAGEYGLTGAALTAYRYETDLLLSAKRQGIELSQTDIDLIRQQAIEYGELSEEIRKNSDELEFRKDVFRGVLGDMVSGLQQGKTVWEAFGDAVLRVVDRIIQKLLDLATDQMFDQLLNLAGTVAGALGGGTGISKAVGNSSGGVKSVVKNATGNAFDSSGITRFAKGGAFTNGIYDSPTLFKFAKGGALGEMGEAGPEAVMPLKRGPDGSLGVQVHGSGGPQEVRVVVTADDERFDAYTDERISGAAPSIMEGSVALTSRRGAFRQSRSLR